MPSPALLFLNLFLGSCGAAYMLYGRRNEHRLATLCGLVLMVAPALISNPLPLLLGSLLVMALPFLLRS
jgi:hypothetical protein